MPKIGWNFLPCDLTQVTISIVISRFFSLAPLLDFPLLLFSHSPTAADPDLLSES